MSYKIPQRKLRESKIVTDYTPEELKYLSNPLGKAAFDYEENSSESYEDDAENSSDYEYYYSEDAEDAEEEGYPKMSVQPIPVSSQYSHSSSEEVPQLTRQNATYDGAVMSISEDSEDEKKPKIVGASVTTKKKAHWSDKLSCEICGGTYTRSAVSSHRGTKKHQIYAKTNKKLLKLMRDD